MELLRRMTSPEAARVERRSGEGGDSSYIVGYASVFNEWTTLIDQKYFKFRERVLPGAFSAALGERQDVRSLFNHDANFVLGRTSSGTLSLKELDRGLYQETRLSGSNLVRDLVEMPVSRGDISGQSFAFYPRNGGGEETTYSEADTHILKRAGERYISRIKGGVEYLDRELISVDLLDVTVATYPAYEGTSVGIRSLADLGISPEDLQALEEIRSKLKGGGKPRPDPAWNVRARMQLRLAECG